MIKKYNLKIAYLGTYPPRRCGIATYTKDLVSAIAKFNIQPPQVIAMNDDRHQYSYPPAVILTIQDNKILDYRKAAQIINQNKSIQLVNLQHEFGIFGSAGKENDGEYILEFLRRIEKPVITTFHTVLPGPTAQKVKILKEISDLSVAVTVMVKMGIKFLTEIYDVDPAKIYFIHHGVPDIGKLESTKKYKEKFGLKDKIVLSTFGLVGPGKGIQYVLRALPELVQKYPNVMYLVLGQTHPQVRKRHGEEYREKLKKEVKELDIEKFVLFENRYLTLDEIIQYLQATDIYITPYLNPQQITSGTLAYAIGAGRPCISTRYLYAKEMLSGGRGIFVDYKNPKDIIKKVSFILENRQKFQLMMQKTYKLGRQMIWSKVAQDHLKLFNKILRPKSIMERPLWEAQKISSRILKIPRILPISKKSPTK